MSTITREQAKDLRNAFECWQQDYDPVEDKEQYDMFGLGVVAMDALLLSLKTEPVAWTDEQELRSVDKDGCGYLFKANPVSPNADPRRVIKLYSAPPVQIVHELCAAIDTLLDMQVRMVKQTNVGASFFDDETISAMNYAPIQARRALELAKQHK